MWNDALGHTSLLMRSKVTSLVPSVPLLVYRNVHTINYCGNVYVYMRLCVLSTYAYTMVNIHYSKYSPPMFLSLVLIHMSLSTGRPWESSEPCEVKPKACLSLLMQVSKTCAFPIHYVDRGNLAVLQSPAA